jgi:hypothetical protein
MGLSRGRIPVTTELATIEAPGLVVTANGPLENLMRYAEILEVSYKFAEKVCRTTIVPKIYQGKPHDAAVAMMHGAELGLNPLQALQNVFPVHGMPSIYAKTMVALLRQKGYRFETHETGPDKVVFQGWSPDGKETETSTWTIDRAMRAGFVPTIDPETGKYKTKKLTGPTGAYEKLIGNEKYISQPEEMLWAKGATTVCKRLASHILLGLAIAEDQEDRADEPEPVRVASERMSPADLFGGDGTAPTSVPVTEWQPPAAERPDVEPASEEGVKPGTSQVDETAQASPDPALELATVDEQRAVSEELGRHGHKTSAAKRKWLSLDTGREIATSKDLTGAEARGIAARLSGREAGDMPIIATQWTEADRMFDQLGVDDEKQKLIFLRNYLDRDDITNPLDLNEREGTEVLAELNRLIADKQAATEGGAE